MQFLSDLQKTILRNLYQASRKIRDQSNAIFLCKEICDDPVKILDACEKIEAHGYLGIGAIQPGGGNQMTQILIHITELGIEAVESEG